MTSRRRFGQHFLEAAWVAKLIDVVEVESTDTFLEIGAGRGALTRPLTARAQRVVAVEIDRDLAGVMQATAPPNLDVVAADFLTLDVRELLRPYAAPVRVIGNLPYNVSSPILFKLAAGHGEGRQFSDATLMLQREVADRLVAAPGTRAYGVLAIQFALHANITTLMTLPPGAFRPPPAVRSSVVRLRFRPPTVDVGNPRTFSWMVRGLFTQRRKTLANALRPLLGDRGQESHEILHFVGIDPKRRPETLQLEETAALTRHLCYIFPEVIDLP